MPKLIRLGDEDGPVIWRDHLAIRSDVVHAGIESATTGGPHLRPLQRTETTGKRCLQIVGDDLSAKQQHRVLLERALQLGESLCITNGIEQRDASDFRAKLLMQRYEFHSQPLL